MAGSAADFWEMPLKIAPVAIQQDLQLDLRALDVFRAVLCAGKATWSVEEDRGQAPAAGLLWFWSIPVTLMG